MNTEPAPNSSDEAIVETAPVSVDSMAEEAAANEQQDVPEVTRPSGSVTVDGDASYQSLPMEALRLERFVGGIFIVIVGVVCLIGMIVPLFVSPATPEVLAGVVFGCLVLFAAVVYGGWIYPKAATVVPLGRSANMVWKFAVAFGGDIELWSRIRECNTATSSRGLCSGCILWRRW